MTTTPIEGAQIDDPDGVIADAAIDPEDAARSHPLAADAPVEDQAPTFAELGVDPRIVRALEEFGIVRTFAIQALTLPIALSGADLIGQARTGMGKTLGFGVPLLQRLAADLPANADAGADAGVDAGVDAGADTVSTAASGPAASADADTDAPAEGRQAGRRSRSRRPSRRAEGRAPRVLVMVPTRELCVQVTRDLHDAAKYLDLSVTSVYGGRAYEPQIAALRAGVDLVVGTPGRLLDLANAGHLVLGGITGLVLDEADEMLDLGFLPDIERVLGMLPDVKQTMLFSATMPGPILTLARSFMSQPTHIRAELPAESAVHKTTTQFVYRAHALDKVEMLARVLQSRARGLTMVFTRTKRTAAKVADELTDRGFAAAAVHGDLGQGAREQALRAFRSGKVDVLVATDVAARGIDVDDVTHVVNYQCPEDEKTYIHRIGRTGRAGKTGVAVSFIDWDDVPRWNLINEALGLGIPDPVETYSTSKHFFEELDIPEGVTGRLPRAQQVRAGLDAEEVEDLGETGRGRRGGSGPSGSGGSGSRGDRGDRGARRRTRGGRGAGQRGAGGESAAPAHGPDAGEPASGDRAPRRRKRRRTRGGAIAAPGGGEPGA